MYTGKLIFAQAMDYLPQHTLRRCIQRYDGNKNIKLFTCQDQYRCMAFAQLTYRESLRDIEACLKAQSNKLYHMGIRSKVARSTLAEANEKRDWRIYADLAQSLIQTARRLYANEDLGLELNNTVYALDVTTIDLCLSVFPWAQFRRAKAAIKLHTLLDLRGNIPSFIHISNGKLHDVNVLDILLPEPGAFYVMDRGYLDYDRLYQLHKDQAFFVIRAKSNLKFRRIYSHHVDKSIGLRCDQTIMLHRLYASQRIQKNYDASSFTIPRLKKHTCFSNQQFSLASVHYHRALSLPLASRAVFQMDKTAPAYQVVLRHIRQRCKNTSMDSRFSLRAYCYHQKTTQNRGKPVFNITDFKPDYIRNNTIKSTAYGVR